MPGILLSGLDASNPLAYLAALGVFRLLSDENPCIRMRWRRDRKWSPELEGTETDEMALCDLLRRLPGVPFEAFESLGKNITVPLADFVRFANEATFNVSARDHRRADFASSFGNEACEEEKKGRIEYTSFCFITGSGHQDFLETMKVLKQKVTAEHLRHSLFQEWTYPDKSLSFRWDPSEAREYALRWNDPGPEGAWTEWGANRLALEALPLFPVFPGERGLQTTGFRFRPHGVREFTWPVWTDFITCDTVRSLLALRELQEDKPRRDRLAAMGIQEIYRSQRIRIGAGANFKVSFRPARSV